MKTWKKILLALSAIAPLTVAFQLKEGYLTRKYCELQDKNILHRKYEEGFDDGVEKTIYAVADEAIRIVEKRTAPKYLNEGEEYVLYGELGTMVNYIPGRIKKHLQKSEKSE